jgi:hypothetical protein
MHRTNASQAIVEHRPETPVQPRHVRRTKHSQALGVTMPHVNKVSTGKLIPATAFRSEFECFTNPAMPAPRPGRNSAIRPVE